MKKWLMKTFCPSASSLAGLAAKGVAESVNGSRADVKERIAKAAAMANTATALANQLAKMAEDGTIDAMETESLQRMMTPAFEAALEYAFNW